MKLPPHFSPVTRAWFESAFLRPTPAQDGAWEAIATGSDALVVAPTGSGKTLAAFLSALDRLVTEPPPDEKNRLRVLYVSPLKALAVDIERNLRSPLAGMRGAAARLGMPVEDVRVGVRTGDTPPAERRTFASHPPDILITTPESLYLLLTSRARDALRNIDVVIVDEIHAICGTKRGAHLALSLERLDQLSARRAQRVGLSATVRPLDEVARFLSGSAGGTRIVNPASDKTFEITVRVPVEDLGAPGGEVPIRSGDAAAAAEERTSIWPHVEETVLGLIQDHKSTIVFVNSRRLAERLCARVNDLASERAGDEIVVARAHHGSVAREQRIVIEEELKAGRLPAVVATSSLELGIDMAAVDLVVQVESPDSVASGLQRIGRAGHQVGATSKGVMFPKYSGDLLDSAVVAERMLRGEIEHLHAPRNPLDVLAQQIVAMVALDEWDVDELFEVVRRAAPFAELPRSAFDATLDMLAGRYPSDEFAELRPRLTWDRINGRLTARRGAQRVAVTSGGTIPDRGLYGVFLATEGGSRVGELDEEMVYESRPGETFILGATTWLIEDITHDRVLVSPAPGRPGKMPFWHGDAPGRPYELGRAQGEFLRDIAGASDGRKRERLAAAGLDSLAADNLLRYLAEQKEATGILPDDRTIVLERFKDELGDWRICVHSPFGAQVHAPWAQAIQARVRERLGIEVQSIYADDGVVIRVPEADEAPPADSVIFDPDEIEEIVVDAVGTSALFAGRFRECAARSLLLPKRRPGSRQPLWQQRQRSAALLQVASKYGSFPVVLETYRECLQDVFDVSALKDLMTRIATREVRIVEIDTPQPSPFASSLLFGFVSAFLYEGDQPLAERRAQALSLDRALLAELLGREELRDLIDDDALASLELELQMLSEERRARSLDDVHDMLLRLGDLTTGEVEARTAEAVAAADSLESLENSRRVVRVRIAGEERWIAAEDAARVRDGLGVALPVGIATSLLEPVADPLGDLISRYARTHGPFAREDPARRLGLGTAVVTEVLGRLQAEGRVVEGEFRPGGRGGHAEWVDVEVLRRLRRRSLAALRREVEPVAPDALGRFLPAWSGIGGHGPGAGSLDALLGAIEQLEGAPVPAGQLERHILPLRVPDYSPALLDQLCAAGEVTWVGAGGIGSDDGWTVLLSAVSAPLLRPDATEQELSPLARALLDGLGSGGASFFRDLAAHAPGAVDDRELVPALWELVWAGLVTNDTMAPLRALTGGAARPARSRRRRGPAFPARLGPPAAAGRWSLAVAPAGDPTRRSHAIATSLLRRHGIVTRGAVAAERLPGGFARVYPVLKAMEESGRCRRGYFVEGLGGAQFAVPGAVDRLRSLTDPGGEEALVLAAADPANPYGAALSWPERDSGVHRAGRKAGAVVVLCRGDLVLYVEKGGRSVVTYADDPGTLSAAAEALVAAARRGLLPGGLHVQRIDGRPLVDGPLVSALSEAGLRPSARGLRLA
ncbi:MAG TPA: DEAD/DEAH box helicase [Actinomycetota bacterium]|nr:DEAD/DEAH box helicase [Actinomycetota bacterium]